MFGDNTWAVKQIIVRIDVSLSLVSENLSLLASDLNFDPVRDKISYNIGYFEFASKDFNNYHAVFSPLNKSYGYIEFNRIYYGSATYPDCALK